MNHDYAHCIDQAEQCPKSCFRRQLNDELKENPTIVPMGIVSWMHSHLATNVAFLIELETERRNGANE